jgi:hypothetical protein
MASIFNIKKWEQIDNNILFDNKTTIETPNNTRFVLEWRGCNFYGNPSYRLYLNDADFRKLCSLKSTDRIGRLYKEKGYLYFTSYNVGYDLERLFKKCGIETGLDEHTLNKK